MRQRVGRRRLGYAAAGAALVLAAAAAALSSTQSTGPTAAVSFDRQSRVLDFRLQSFDGGSVDSSDLRGTPVVLNFYASWCAICDRELPDFERVSQRLAGRVHVVGVNPQSNDSDRAQAAMIARNGVTYPTVRDPRDELLRQFNATGGLPTTVLLDGAGVVRKVHNGLLTEQQLLAEIASAFGPAG